VTERGFVPNDIGKPRSDLGSPRQSAADRPAETVSRSRMTVLLVDDVADARDLYALYFKHLGIRVVAAGDGQAALTAARVERPDVIVLDLAMPGIAGWDVLRTVKGNPQTRSIRILVLSGQTRRTARCVPVRMPTARSPASQTSYSPSCDACHTAILS
jgi:CheY-like chemotaxis protein